MPPEYPTVPKRENSVIVGELFDKFNNALKEMHPEFDEQAGQILATTISYELGELLHKLEGFVVHFHKANTARRIANG